MRVTKLLLGLTYVLMLVSCQTTAPAQTAAEPEKVPVEEKSSPIPLDFNSIVAARDGFSPRAAAPANTLAFAVHWSQPSEVVQWEVQFAAGGNPVRTLEGKPSLTTVTWDGRNDAGDFPNPGLYRAVLRWAGSDGTWVEAATSQEFLLDLVPPYGALSVTPNPFTEGDSITIDLDVISGDSDWTVWRLAVFHPDGRRFRDFISEDHRSDQVVWDGRAANNAVMESGVTYRLEAEVFDVYGNRGTITTTLSKVAAAPLVVTLDGTKLAELPVYFPPFSADLTAVSPEERAVNEASLASLAELLKEASKVVIVGHANQVFYDDPDKAALEQKDELIPLSLARSEAVLASLVALGVPAETLEARGVGAQDPVVPFSDAANRWKNRRVVVELTSS